MNQAIRTLDALGCQYRIVTTAGVEYGTLETAKPKKPRKPGAGKRLELVHSRGREWGEFSRYIKPLIAEQAIGDVVVIPKGKYDLDELARNVSNYAGLTWGRGNFKALRNAEGIEVLRIA